MLNIRNWRYLGDLIQVGQFKRSNVSRKSTDQNHSGILNGSKNLTLVNCHFLILLINYLLDIINR